MRLLISGVVFLFLVRLDAEATLWSSPLNTTGNKNALVWRPSTSFQITSKFKSFKGSEPIESVFDDITEILHSPEVFLHPITVVHIQQEKRKTFCNPAAPPECVDKTFGFCINDIEYPEDDIKVAIELSELAQKFTYKRINDAIRLQLEFENKDSECPYRSLVIKPIRARNIDGQWRVIVQNVEDILQRERIVICGSLDYYCQASRHFSPVHCYNSRCSQQFLVRHLLAYDPCNPNRGAFVDSFKLQSACSCRYSRTPC